MSFANQHIWLIGASTGIGAQLARDLAAAGAKLSLSSRDQVKLEALKSELKGDGHDVYPLDVTQQTSVDLAWAALNKAGGMPDIVIYNAGAYEPMSATRYDADTAIMVADTNFMGAFRVLEPVLPAFMARGQGHIVLTGSLAGIKGLPNAIGYGASKAGIIHLAENLRLDLAGSGIKVQLVNPGFVKTRLTDKNEFNMPFLLTPEDASERIMKGLLSDRFETNFPKRLTFLIKALRYMPDRLYYKLLRNKPAKT
ncbi:SDR family NAD(P)-dependent oxidoreductase [Asticcacaulis sp. ZE23SCel15]|uniref:SDR family NAD(P)-dependent oxidoreductase n=1 Tax=Asticcacaulis sp. ZE23SCel15 TaxID=3059027 RepID=UPI00265F013E|nr:SDR family NAD(P)-dependent oxidoreductase [Asticcacaulis sp. ZE23SCel15]WKL58464.1 SDR family NAD(P)-dependent oxidoreductase [Asticcacaulis sp. ZE23SCel15]